MRNFIYILLAVSFIACHKKESTNDSIDLGYNYFPTQLGATWIYNVDSLVYDDNSGFTTIDTFEYQYQEKISSNFIDNEGKTNQLVSRYFRINDTLPWLEANSWTVLRTEQYAQKVEENVRYAKLVFPLQLNKTWNGNMYNTLGIQDYAVVAYNTPFQMGVLNFEQSLTVLQKDEINAIEEIKQQEVFVRNIGLVYSISDSINTQVSGSRGYRYRLTLKSFTP